MFGQLEPLPSKLHQLVTLKMPQVGKGILDLTYVNVLPLYHSITTALVECITSQIMVTSERSLDELK